MTWDECKIYIWTCERCHSWTTFLQTPYSTSNDEHDNDYMINWPYFCIKISSKSTVTDRCQKVSPLRMNLPLFCRPPIAHSIVEHNNDYMMNWPYFLNEPSSKSTVTDRRQKVSPVHPNLGHFGRPPIANSIDELPWLYDELTILL